MNAASLERRYAESLFAVSEKHSLTEKVMEDLRLICGTCSDEALAKTLSAPSILVSDSEKKAVLRELFGGRVCGISLNFLFLLVDRKRTGLLKVFAEGFEALVYESRNVETCFVESAVPLSEEDPETLRQGLEARLSKKLILNKTAVCPSLIGGVRVTVKNDVLDGSIAAALTDIKRSLLSL